MQLFKKNRFYLIYLQTQSLTATLLTNILYVNEKNPNILHFFNRKAYNSLINYLITMFRISIDKIELKTKPPKKKHSLKQDFSQGRITLIV